MDTQTDTAPEPLKPAAGFVSPYWEDYAIGRQWTGGHEPLTEESIIAFGRLYDPQPFHVDPEAAKDSIFGRLVGSSSQTIALMTRMWTQMLMAHDHLLAGPGYDEIRFERATEPGDVLSLRVTLVDKRPQRSRADRGMLTFLVEVLRQDGETILSARAPMICARRPAA
ncbi:MaoC/PaaZ C-terminal domain-containing protein [Minwuia thermotolerans]|nr:MaoC/PaaZ C-terminal domain-containing protein [Minwuia thermotolerans]